MARLLRTTALVAALALWTGCGSLPDDALRPDPAGGRYRLKRLAKTPGWELLDPRTVRVPPHAIYRLERMDDRWLYVREYEPVTVAPAPPLDLDPLPVGESLGSSRFALVRVDSGLPASGQWRTGFVLADIDGDGRLDLVHGPPRKSFGKPRLFQGDGTARFRSFPGATYPDASYDYGAAAAADLDGDGHLDLVLAAHLRGLTLLRGDGTGRFSAWPGPRIDFGSRAIAIADWNADGRPDVLLLADGPLRPDAEGFRVLLDLPSGFVLQGDGQKGDGVFGDQLAVLDGGRAAVLASHSYGKTTLLRQATPDGFLALPLEGARAKAYTRAVAAGRLDDDATDDVVLGSTLYTSSGPVAVLDALLRKPSGTLRRTLWVRPGRVEITSVAIGDVDGDGAPDVVALLSDGSLAVFPGDGHGSFTRDATAVTPATREGCGGSQVRLADLDGDGHAEIVASFAGEPNALRPEAPCSSGGALEVWRVLPSSVAEREAR